MMAQLFGTLGVTILLLAFVLNLLKRLASDSAWYLSLNVIGASLAALYAALAGTIPFVILESVWGAAALIQLIQAAKRAPS